MVMVLLVVVTVYFSPFKQILFFGVLILVFKLIYRIVFEVFAVSIPRICSVSVEEKKHMINFSGAYSK